MARNQAIVIGINQYNPNNLTPLNYAKRDAELVRDFLEQEAGFKVYFFSDDAAEINLRPGVSIPSQPTLGNLESFLLDYFEKPRLKAGDNFWFFFAGHGMPHADRDYLMPCDGNPRNVERTAIPVSYVTERLRRCGADNVVLIVDACRNGGRGLGIGGERQQGVVTIFSCSPGEISYEIEQLQQGAFTHTLLEALRIQGEGNCATVERLYQYLSYRVPELNRQHNKPRQTPYIIAEPATKFHLILLPRYATLRDIETLKLDACKAELEGDLELAKQLWIRVNIAAMGSDMDVILAFQRIAQRVGHEVVSQASSESQVRGGRSPQPPLPRGAKSEAKPEDEGVKLVSAVGMDYGNLRDLLAAGKWKEADEETARVMLKVAGREKEGWLDTDSIEKFPCEDLRTIDQLWVKYSNGRFGFSVQKRIWLEVGGKPGKRDDEVWEKFGDRVGWRSHVINEWRYYSDLTFYVHAPKGHLPAFVVVFWWGRGLVFGPVLFSRVETCKL
jgi:uncharacterized caspase-like protein